MYVQPLSDFIRVLSCYCRQYADDTVLSKISLPKHFYVPVRITNTMTIRWHGFRSRLRHANLFGHVGLFTELAVLPWYSLSWWLDVRHQVPLPPYTIPTSAPVTDVHTCISDLLTWMTRNKLSLNACKTELLSVGSASHFWFDGLRVNTHQT